MEKIKYLNQMHIPQRDYEAGSMTLNIFGGLAFAAAGFIANMSLLLAPVHEIGHLITAILFSGGGISMEWSAVYYSGRASGIVSASGFVFEAWVWGYIMYLAFRRDRFWLYSFFFGVLTAVPVQARYSLDYIYGDMLDIKQLWGYGAVVTFLVIFWTAVVVFYFLGVAMLEKFSRRDRIRAENLAYWEELQMRQHGALTPTNNNET